MKQIDIIMRKSSLFWLVMLILWIILGVFLCWKFLCKSHGDTNQNAVGKAETKTEKPIEKATGLAALGLWKFKDGDFSVTSEDHLQFDRNNSVHITPVSADLDNELLSTVNYLNENPSRSMTIVGYYDEDETNTSILDNLGLARANKFKKHLLEMGAPPSQLAIDSKLLSENWFDGDILKKGIDFRFNEVAADVENDLSAIKDRIKANPIVLYFETNAKTIDLDSDQRKAFADIIRYLDNVDGSKLKISGHTDSVGDAKQNQYLSRKRAEFVQDYLVTNGGISKNSSIPTGYGETKPVADNKTNEGRAQNRRVEVTF